MIGFVIGHLYLRSLAWKETEGAGRKQGPVFKGRDKEFLGRDKEWRICVWVSAVLERRVRQWSVEN